MSKAKLKNGNMCKKKNNLRLQNGNLLCYQKEEEKKIYKWSDQLDLLTCEESDGQAESVPAADEASSIFVMSWNRDLHRSPPQNS